MSEYEDKTGASDEEFEARIAPFELNDPRGTWTYQTTEVPVPAPQGEEGGAWRWHREPGTGDEWEQVWTCCGGPYDERPSGHYADCPAIGGCSR